MSDNNKDINNSNTHNNSNNDKSMVIRTTRESQNGGVNKNSRIIKRTGARRVGGPTLDPHILVEAALSNMRLAYDYKKARAMLLWPDIVGADIARLTRARSVHQQVLLVEAKDSAIAHHLGMQRHYFLEKLNATLAEPLQDIRFVTGQIISQDASNSAQESPDMPPADPQKTTAYMATLDATLPNLSDELRQVAQRLAEGLVSRQQWQQQQGWQICDVCQQLCNPRDFEKLAGANVCSTRNQAHQANQASRTSDNQQKICKACQINLNKVVVQRASRRLARHPENLPQMLEELGSSYGEAARYLALQSLTEQLQSLALFVVRNAANTEADLYAPLLLEQASLYLALRLRVPRQDLQNQDDNLLPAQALAVVRSLKKSEH